MGIGLLKERILLLNWSDMNALGQKKNQVKSSDMTMAHGLKSLLPVFCTI